MSDLELLDSREVEGLVADALRVLEAVGVAVECDRGRALLLEGGAREEGARLLISEAMVRRALGTAPPRVRVYDRGGALALDLGSGRTHFDPGSAAIHLHDLDRGRREITSADAVRFARLADALPGYEAQATALCPADVPQEVADRWRLYLVLRHSTKPVVTGTFRVDGFAPMHAMLAAVRGSAAALAERPLAIFDCCPSPPLTWSTLTARALVDCARTGVPANLVSMPMAGATAPVTLREAAVQQCAENLSGVVLHQLAGPGAPVIYGGAPAAFDMRRGTTPMGAVETMMIDALAAQAGRALGLPTHAYLAVSDAKVPDYQAGMETAVGAVLAVLAGVDLVSGPGMLDTLLTQSLEKLVLDHDAVLLAQRLARGVATRGGDTVSLMGDLVAAGSLLAHDHTRAHWREELSLPSPVVDRESHGDWTARGSPWAHDRARDRVEKLLARHEPEPLDEGLATELEGIMRVEARAWGLEALPPGL